MSSYPAQAGQCLHILRESPGPGQVWRRYSAIWPSCSLQLTLLPLNTRPTLFGTSETRCCNRREGSSVPRRKPPPGSDGHCVLSFARSSHCGIRYRSPPERLGFTSVARSGLPCPSAPMTHPTPFATIVKAARRMTQRRAPQTMPTIPEVANTMQSICPIFGARDQRIT